MADSLDIETFLDEGKLIPVIDVRTPSEYQQGHIPGALNLPLFSDDERAEIGTIYTQISRDESIKRGLEFVGPKMRDFVEQALEWCPRKQALVHCWRGGMRSQSMAWLLQFSGIQTKTLEGGYKSYRNFALQCFEPPQNIIILGGMTGSGKTHVLHKLKEQGEQVIDLEGLAHHKGSAFGSLGEKPQPSNEHFENLIAYLLKDMDPQRPVWLEDESINIGKNKIPDALFKQMRSAPIVELKVPHENRIKQLVSDYSQYPIDELKESVLKIERRLGGQRTKQALDALDEENYALVADLTLMYYDKTYKHGLSLREPNSVYPLETGNSDHGKMARLVIEKGNEIISKTDFVEQHGN